jgi:hypothetical protein
MKKPTKLRMPLCWALLFLAAPIAVAEQKALREEGQLSVYVSGKEVGREKFSIQSTDDSISSSSSISFRDPASRKNVKMETELKMNAGLVPQSYLLRTEMSGQKMLLKGTFAAGQAMFEYVAAGNLRKTGLLVGDRFTVLDTNVFHHFIFIARLYDFESKEKTQPMEVVVPYELGNGLLKVGDMGRETVSIRGGKRELHHLKADSGMVNIDLWVDDRHVLYKIALPAKGIEVVRD